MARFKYNKGYKNRSLFDGRKDRMLLEGCQGKKGVEIQERVCPNCGNVVELMSTDIFAECEVCGCTVYSSLMECARTCPKARECVGDECYARLMAARRQWEARMEQKQDDDQW